MLLFFFFTFKVSVEAANKFWDLSMKYVPEIITLRDREQRTNSIPKFISQRRNMYLRYSPDVQMEFGFKRKFDGSIIEVTAESAPLKALQRNHNYIKLYEIASVKVNP